MTGRAARFGRALAAVALAAATGSAAVATGSAAPAAAAVTCTAPSVRILVDFRHWPTGFDGIGSAGNLVSACVPFTSGMTGIDLIDRAGFTHEGTAHDGPQFLCRFNGLPAASGNPAPQQTESCVNTPPATAYWSYWYAKPGETRWTYSSYGAYSNTVTPGRVEAWVYGGTDIGGTTGQPSFSPQSVMPTPATKGTTPASSVPAGAASVPATHGAGTPAGGAASSSAPVPMSTSPTATTSSSGASPGTSAPTSGAAAASTPTTSTGGDATPSSVDIDAIAKPAGSTSSGTPWATVATVIVLVVAAMVGGGIAWRRKRASS